MNSIPNSCSLSQPFLNTDIYNKPVYHLYLPRIIWWRRNSGHIPSQNSSPFLWQKLQVPTSSVDILHSVYSLVRLYLHEKVSFHITIYLKAFFKLRHSEVSRLLRKTCELRRSFRTCWTHLKISTKAARSPRLEKGFHLESNILLNYTYKSQLKPALQCWPCAGHVQCRSVLAMTNCIRKGVGRYCRCQAGAILNLVGTFPHF